MIGISTGLCGLKKRDFQGPLPVHIIFVSIMRLSQRFKGLKQGTFNVPIRISFIVGYFRVAKTAIFLSGPVFIKKREKQRDIRGCIVKGFCLGIYCSPGFFFVHSAKAFPSRAKSKGFKRNAVT